MFGPSYVPFWTAIAALAAAGQVALLALSAYFVYRYLQETKKLRISAQQQADAAFKPAIVARCLGSMTIHRHCATSALVPRSKWSGRS
jgi:hypothetical protein